MSSSSGKWNKSATACMHAPLHSMMQLEVMHSTYQQMSAVEIERQTARRSTTKYPPLRFSDAVSDPRFLLAAFSEKIFIGHELKSLRDFLKRFSVPAGTDDDWVSERRNNSRHLHRDYGRFAGYFFVCFVRSLRGLFFCVFLIFISLFLNARRFHS